MDESEEDRLPSYEEATKQEQTKYPPKRVDQLDGNNNSQDCTSQSFQPPATAQPHALAQPQVHTGAAQNGLRITHPELLASDRAPFPYAPFLSLEDEPIEIPGLMRGTRSLSTNSLSRSELTSS